jgi:SAM-dependent methyltransferase
MKLRAEPEIYQGHAIAAAPGTHQAVVEAVKKRVPLTADILDLGGYSGALARRLHDTGFMKVGVADLANHLTEPDVAFTKCDFNEPFAERFDRKFDCITACEVIEHLNDPRHFLHECRKLLNDGGIIVISTPNIGFFEGRLKFLLKGELWGFGANNYQGVRHISAISREQFPLLLEETGFRQLDFHTAASFATPLRKAITLPLWAAMRLSFGPHVLGESAVCVGQASASVGRDLSSSAYWGERRD